MSRLSQPVISDAIAFADKQKPGQKMGFNPFPGTTPTSRKISRPPVPLFSSDTWATGSSSQARSAGMPPKASWESIMEQRASLRSGQVSGSSISTGTMESPNTDHMIHSKSVFGCEDERTPTSKQLIAEPRSSFGTSNVYFKKTEQNHISTVPPNAGLQQGGLVIQSDPLPQGPWKPYEHGTGQLPGGGGTFDHGIATVHTLRLTNPTHNAQAKLKQGMPALEGQKSIRSNAATVREICDEFDRHQVGAKGDVWTEQPQNHSLRRALKDSSCDWFEAYPGSISILTAVNPEAYQMPHGTRAVNIKTDFPENVLRSIQDGKYAVMEKIASRIMQVWDERRDPCTKVLFLFSVNGSKKFCGIAEMNGPWESQGSILGWKEKPDGDRCAGVFPITWVFIKDVAYHQFNHIRQKHNDAPVGNMWNGMNFPEDIARQVIECYVKCPATSSILGHPKNYVENVGLVPLVGVDRTSVSHPRRAALNNRGSRGGRGVSRGSATMKGISRRGMDTDLTTTTSEDELTPVATNGTSRKTNTEDTQDQGQQLMPWVPGQVMSAVVNEQGQIVLVAPQQKFERAGNVKDCNQDHLPNTVCATTPGSLDAHHEAAGYPAGLYGLESANHLHKPASSLSTLRPRSEITASSKQSLRSGISITPGSDSSPTFGPRASAEYLALPQSRMANTAHVGTIPIATQSVDETPTHRPASRSGRVLSNAVHAQPELSDLGDNLARAKSHPVTKYSLKANFHKAAAEQYTLQDELQDPAQTDMNIRILNAKLARVLAEKREIETKLKMMVVSNTDSSASKRYESFSSQDEGESSSASGYGLCIQNSRRLKSNSKLQTSNIREDSVHFDPAPGGSFGPKRGHIFTESRDLQIKKSISDLLKSPDEDNAVPALPAHETSNFFAETGKPATANRYAFSLDAPVQASPLSAGFSIDTPTSLSFPFQNDPRGNEMSPNILNDYRTSWFRALERPRFEMTSPTDNEPSEESLDGKRFSFSAANNTGRLDKTY